LKYLKKIANRAKTGIFKPFQWEGNQYKIEPVSGRDYKWLLWDKCPFYMKAIHISLDELTAEELSSAIHQLVSYRILEEIHDS